MIPWRRGRATALMGVALLAAGLSPAVVSAAPSGPTSTVAPVVAAAPTQLTPPPFAILDQTAFVPADGSFDVTIRWPTDRGADSLIVTVFGVLGNEDDIGSTPVDVLNRRTYRLEEIPRDDAGDLMLSLPIRAAATGEGERIFIPSAGVYPVELALTGPDGAVATVETHLIRLPGETAEIDPLPVAIVMPVAAADDLTVEDAIRLLTEHPSIPVTVVLERGVLTQLENSPELAAELRAALGERPITSEPVVALDPSALAEAGLSELHRVADISDRRRFDAIGLPLTPGLAVNDLRLTDDGVALLAGEAPLTIIDTSAGATRSGTLRRSPEVINVQPDPDDSRALRVHPDQVGRVHELLARLTLRATADRAPVVLGAGSADGRVAAGPLDVVLDALGAPGPVGPVPLADIRSAVGALPLRPAERPSQDLGPLVEPLAEILDDIETYRSTHVTGEPRPDRLRNDLIAAITTDRNPDDRIRAVDRVRTELDGALGFVTLPDQGSVTLATERHPLPIRFESTASGTRRVRLQFESDKLITPDDVVISLPPGATTTDVEVITRSLGLTPLEVIVSTPDGRRQLASTTIRIRSTAVPGLGLLLSGTALAFLIGWWLVSIGKTRRRRREEADAAGTDAADTAAPRTGAEAGGTVDA